MTRVLLITDIERVQRVFQALEDEGVLQLRTVSTLALSDEELAEYRPDHIFAQSRISGFSSDLALHNLRKGVPPETRIVLLPVDEGDLAQARKQAKLFLSLGRDDAGLAEGVRRMLNPEAHPGPPSPEAAEEAPALAGEGKPAAVKKARAVKTAARAPRAKAGATTERGEQPVKAAATAGKRKSAGRAAGEAAPVVPEERAPEGPAAGGTKPEGGAALPIAKSDFIAGEAQAALPVEEPGPQAGEEPAAEVQVAGAESFADIMQRAAAKQGEEPAPPGAPPEPSGPAVSSEPPDRSDRSDSEAPEEIDEETLPVEAVPFAEPETLANGRLHAGKSKPRWIVPLLLVLLFVPIAYVATILLRQSKLYKPTPASAPGPATTPKPSRSVAPPAAKPVPQAKPVRPAKPVPPVAPAPAPATSGTPASSAPAPGKPTSLQPSAGKPTPAKAPSAPAAPAAKPAARAGLKALPPFMAGVSVDPSYAARHPGWQRYLGARGEYKIYREGDLYRALQIIALPGQSIPDDIYQRSLLEFGGIDSYRVQSSEKKGSLLIEHGEAKGGVGVIVYRKLKDQSLKGLVIYYH